MSGSDKIWVINRKGEKKEIDLMRIRDRLAGLMERAPAIKDICVDRLLLLTVRSIADKITTTQIDEYSAKVAESMSVNNPNYYTLASRIFVYTI